MGQPAPEKIDSRAYKQRDPHTSHYCRRVKACFEKVKGTGTLFLTSLGYRIVTWNGIR